MYGEITPEICDVNDDIVEGLGTVFVMSEPDETEKKKWVLKLTVRTIWMHLRL